MKITLKERLNELVRSTFIGFLISAIIMYLKPELQASIITCYGILAGKRAFEIHSINKNKDVQDGKP